MPILTLSAIAIAASGRIILSASRAVAGTITTIAVRTVATSIAHALSMPLEERRARHAALFQVISENDIHWWGEHFLSALTKEVGRPLWHEQLGVTRLYSDIA